jgi:hypothetical protein
MRMLQCRSPLVAQSGHLGPRESRLLLGVKRIPRHVCVMSANDPKRTSQPPLTSHRQIASIGLPAAGMDRIFR